jgi:hypothetical protein|tara:strand:+ start:501 stop:713 length:213 start_codon:yes stop_codon:yes gene_type:complete
MNQEEKGRRYDWLLGQHKQVENEIARVPKLPLEETFQSMDSSEYTPQNQELVNQLMNKIAQIDNEVRKLF